jgi:hypothetical protein
MGGCVHKESIQNEEEHLRKQQIRRQIHKLGGTH